MTELPQPGGDRRSIVERLSRQVLRDPKNGVVTYYTDSLAILLSETPEMYLPLKKKFCFVLVLKGEKGERGEQGLPGMHGKS